MGNYFGTDGIRGEYGKFLTCELALKVGNALSQIKKNPKIIIGHDTRVSADAIMLSLSAGAVKGGANITCVGTITTAGISFLTEKENFDFGVIITASHNPPNYNGIKVFGPNGQKILNSEEDFLEEFIKNDFLGEHCGRFVYNSNLTKKYCNHLLSCITTDLAGIKVCLDLSNGASYKIGPEVFKKAGAKVYAYANKNDGEKINENCGSLHIENLFKKVLKTQSDVGFAFDGDADRIIAVSGNGEVFDGDKLLYILACQFKKENNLFANAVVGTSHTNSGIMMALNRQKINLIRTDIGDKYVIEAMEKMNLSLGGEQSGHIIIKKYAQTGDGILSGLKICEIIKTTGKTLEQLFDAKLVPQANANVSVNDKIKIINNEKLNNLVNQISNEISPAGRVLVRASGTENKIRIMVEHTDEKQAKKYVEAIKSLIKSI